MRLGVLFSGGKDSTYSAFLVKKQGHELVCLISVLSENPDSYMFQYVKKEKIEELANKIGLPAIFQKTMGEKEEELKDLEKAIQEAKKKFKIEGIVTGAVASNYQKSRIEKICNKLKLECINPIWGIESEKYWKDLISNEFKIKIVKVAADGLDEFWVGKIINEENLEKLRKLSDKFRFDLRFEGGEAETEVIDCPLFEKKLVLVSCLVVNDKKEILLLYRKDHKHWETPGGKPEKDENLEDAANRELHEELGNVKTSHLKLFTKVEFTVPDGRKAIAHKFITKIISGTPRIQEPEIFEKCQYLPINNLEDSPISPDLKIILPKLKEIK